MLNIPEYKEYGGETKIALMDNSSLAFMHELSQRSYPSDGILSVYDLILIPKWVMEEIEDSTYRSTYVEQLQAQGYPIRWIDETKYGTFVNDEDVNLYYIVEAAVSRVSELMRFLRREVKTEDLIDLPSAEEWMNRLYDEWPIHGRTLSTGRALKKNAGEISLTILAEIFAWYHDGVDSLTIYTQDTDAGFFVIWSTGYKIRFPNRTRLLSALLPSGSEFPVRFHCSPRADGEFRNLRLKSSASNYLPANHQSIRQEHWQYQPVHQDLGV